MCIRLAAPSAAQPATEKGKRLTPAPHALIVVPERGADVGADAQAALAKGGRHLAENVPAVGRIHNVVLCQLGVPVDKAVAVHGGVHDVAKAGVVRKLGHEGGVEVNGVEGGGEGGVGLPVRRQLGLCGDGDVLPVGADGLARQRRADEREADFRSPLERRG